MQADLGTGSANGYKRLEIVSNDGAVLVGDDGGPPGAPVVILMHGGGQTRHSWSGAMRPLLARGYRVINYDARGHGDSGWSDAGAYELDDRVDDLGAVLGVAGSPFALVGASLGGAVAVHAIASGMRPAAVVLVDIVPDAEPAGIQRIIDFMRHRPEGFANLDEAADAVASYNPARSRPRDPRGLMRNLRQGEDGRLRWHWDPRILADGNAHHAQLRRSAERMAAGSPPPIRLVRGLQSDVVSDAGVAAFRRLLPALEVVDVAGAGHMVAGDRNDAFTVGLLDFLSRHMPASSAPE